MNSRPWGFWATTLLGLLLLLAYGIFQIIGVGLSLVGQLDGADAGQAFARASSDGDAVALGVCFAVVPAAGLIYVLLLVRGRTSAIGLRLPPRATRQTLLWTVACLGFSLVADQLGQRLGIPEVPETMLNLYQSAERRWLFLVAVIFMGPFLEELLFRGFMLDGWRNTRAGATLAVILTSALWTVIHTQYLDEVYYLGVIFGIGLLIGAARVRTGSLAVPLVMHFANNTAAVAELALAAAQP